MREISRLKDQLQVQNTGITKVNQEQDNGAQVGQIEENKQTARRKDEALRDSQAVIEELRSKIDIALEAANETIDKLNLPAEEIGEQELREDVLIERLNQI